MLEGMDIMGSGKARWVKSLSGYAGLASVYDTTKGTVVVSRANTFDRGDETMIFKWDARLDKVSDWSELYVGYGETHEEALYSWLSE